MRGHWLNRGQIAAACVVVTLTTAAASLGADLNGAAYRFAGAFDTPVILPDDAVGPQNVLRNPLEEITAGYALTDSLSLQTGFNADVGRMLDRYTAGTDSLFYSGAALGSSYTGLSSGGLYSGLRAKLADGLELSLGQASSAPGLNRYLVNSNSAYAAMGGRLPVDLRYTNSVLAGMTWNFTRWAGVNFTASRTAETGGALGVSNPLIGTARTSAMGVAGHVSFGGGWVTTASYSEGLTQLELRPGALAPNPSLRTEAFGVAVAKHGLFNKNDAFGVAFAQPAPGFSGLTSADKSGDMQFFGRDKLLSTMSKETDIELGYKTEFFGDSVAVQANASYQMNYGGMTGRDSVSLLSKAKIKF